MRGTGIEAALRLRAELVAAGWGLRQLHKHDEILLPALPSLAEVMKDLPKWSALGVRPSLSSEQTGLVLPELAPPREGTHGGQQQPSPADGGDDDAARERAGGGSKGASDPEEMARPASVSEEIWERKGWNQIDGGWRGFF